ncbi:short-chain dehydrogenase [Ahniella affigens]|uniref:Short-chain dehydrogenase n=1 Tax=Ahniella affigens TaxID=2021234 RepID=A0A2P1PNJ1_9GAMM|nr:SDR family oxidoreductase [Ahniella affigens]AVP96408.1 short-chain dehydrogenase [Ahniella affigens]
MNRNIAVITGGSRGLGRNTALHLAKQGIDVILTYHSRLDEAQSVVAQIEQLGARAQAVQLDVTNSAGFADFTKRLSQCLETHWQQQRFNYLINNAGMGAHAAFVDTTEAQLDQMYQAHLKAPFLLTQALLPHLADGGRIVNISSGLARFSLPGYAAYAAMKGGVEVLTRYLAKELGPRGIRVNTLAPGAIETDFGGGAVRDNAALNAAIASQTALGRVGLPDDIGGAIAVLVSDAAGWINGQRIEVSGGIGL